MTTRDAILRDLDAVEQHSEWYECGDGCCSGYDNPLAEEGSRLREEVERLWAIEDLALAYMAEGGTTNGRRLRDALGVAD